jgi:membrane-associated phospholipid phosphatase
LCVAAPAAAQQPDSLAAAHLSQSSLFRSSDLVYAGLFFGSLAAVYPLEKLDEELSPERLPTGFPGAFDSAGSLAGNGFVVYGLSGITFLTGTLIGNKQVARIGLRSAEALVLADLIVFPFKVGVGRRRPTGGDPDSDEFEPFSFTTEYYSFPSGHTAHMFAIASTLSRELKHQAPWVPFVAYPVAAMVGASRVVGKKHWVTDVVGGAAAGLFAGHFVGRLHGEENVGLRTTPYVSTSEGTVYVGVHLSFR